MRPRRIITLPFVSTLCALAAVSLCWPPASVARQTAAAPSVATGGSISGHIYRGDTGAPSVGTVISLLATPTNGVPIQPNDLYLQTVRTGLDGAYKFSSVEPGTYRVHVIKGNGFSPREPSQTVSLAAGQSVENVDLRFQPTENQTPVADGRPVQSTDGQTGAISGTVRDQNNAPIEGIGVIVLCGEPTGRGGITGDQGNYRVTGLAPGDCHVQVRAGPGGPIGQVGYHQVYYPNAETIDKAQLVSIKAGAEITNINLTVPYSTTYRIHVKVLDNGGGGDNNYIIFASGGGLLTPTPTPTHPDGAAELRGVLPGTYAIAVKRATVRNGPNGLRSFGLAGNGQSIGGATVQVVDADVNVEIPISSFPPSAR